MPGEHFLRSGEMALELFFVLAGAAEVIEVVSGVPVVKKSIRGDLPDTPSVVGEISFFLGVPLQNDVRAGLDQAMEEPEMREL
ncbi:hypothetical protein T484DRAFT_1854397 [Baffinella frigidus]|nr:hypothetical protein T484DRAFT_1854397 [Cryptophyta sp. CCMP2293]